MAGQCRKCFQKINFVFIEDTSQFNEDSTRNYNEERDEGYIVNSDFWFSVSWKIIWPSQWFTIFTWKNENWLSRKACS